MDQHMDATGATWDRYNKALADFVIENHEGNILEIGGEWKTCQFNYLKI